MTDPQQVHGGECDGCHEWVCDNEQDLTTFGCLELCDDCIDAHEAERAEEMADPDAYTFKVDYAEGVSV
jgi:hypothetical protein